MTNPQNDTSRRDFLKTSTAAVGAGLALNSALSTSAYAAAGDETIKVGLIGCGGRGTGAASQALSTEGPVELVAMADAFEDRLQASLKNVTRALGDKSDRVQVAKENQFVGFDAYKQVLEAGVDLVILATPPGFRPIHFEAAVNAGKHVFTEKPVATDGPGVRRFLAANEVAKQKDLKVGVGLQRHHQATYMETIQRLKDGAIGDIVSMRCYWNGGGVWEPRASRDQVKTEMEYQMRNWYYYNWLCGDHIVEQHIHNLDVCNWLMGDFPVKAYGMGGREVRTDARYGNIFDHHAVEYEYADGTRMYSQCRHIRGCWNSVNEYAAGSKGTSDISRSIIRGEGEPWRFRGKSKNPYQQEHDDLFAAIRAGEKYNEGDYGARSTMTAIMGRMATYSGKPIELDKALASGRDIMPQEFSWDAKPPSLPQEDGSYAIPTPGVFNPYQDS